MISTQIVAPRGLRLVNCALDEIPQHVEDFYSEFNCMPYDRELIRERFDKLSSVKGFADLLKSDCVCRVYKVNRRYKAYVKLTKDNCESPLKEFELYKHGVRCKDYRRRHAFACVPLTLDTLVENRMNLVADNPMPQAIINHLVRAQLNLIGGDFLPLAIYRATLHVLTNRVARLRDELDEAVERVEQLNQQVITLEDSQRRQQWFWEDHRGKCMMFERARMS